MLDHMIIRAAEIAEDANTDRPGALILGSAAPGALAGSAAYQANTHQYI